MSHHFRNFSAKDNQALTTFRNSRIFPVQSYSFNKLIAAEENFLTAFPCSKQSYPQNEQHRDIISSIIQSRNFIKITAKRW
jgi:hypothetical protein